MQKKDISISPLLPPFSSSHPSPTVVHFRPRSRARLFPLLAVAHPSSRQGKAKVDPLGILILAKYWNRRLTCRGLTAALQKFVIIIRSRPPLSHTQSSAHTRCLLIRTVAKYGTAVFGRSKNLVKQAPTSQDKTKDPSVGAVSALPRPLRKGEKKDRRGD